MLSETEYIKHDALGLAALVKRREVTPQELLETAVKRVERINPQINAIITPMLDEARIQLQNLDMDAGPFSGVPFLLKDLRASYKGVRTTVGNAFMTSVPDFDSVITTRFKEAGLIIFGKTNIPEMGLSIDTQNAIFGATHNPWMQGRSSGGSSGGSAAAVAARIVPMAHASDGGGSTRVPSSCCGLFGLKTSKGRVTYAPDTGDELNGLSTQHACTISVRDSAALLDVDGQPDFGDPYFAPPGPSSYLAAIQRPPNRLRIAFTTVAPNGTKAHQDCIDAVQQAAMLCESLGHSVEEASPEIQWNQGLAESVDTIFGVGMYASVKAKAALKGVAFSARDFLPGIWKFLEIGERASGADYYMAVKRLQQLSRDMARFHETYSLLLTPTLSVPPPRHQEFDYGASGSEDYIRQFWSIAAFMPLANASGQPAMTIPLHWNHEGLPIGVQFIGRYGDEETLLRLAAQLEVACPWALKMPKIATSGMTL